MFEICVMKLWTARLDRIAGLTGKKCVQVNIFLVSCKAIRKWYWKISSNIFSACHIVALFLSYRRNLSQLTIDMWIESSLLQGGSRIEDDIPLRRKAELVIGLHLHTQHWNRLPRLRSRLEELWLEIIVMKLGIWDNQRTWHNFH